MSRIGKLPVKITEGVSVEIKGQVVTVKGPKGQVTKEFNKSVLISVEDNQVIVKPANKDRFSMAYYGTVRSIINSMVIGVCRPFSKKLELHGVGFRGAMKGRVLDLNLGYSHDILYEIPFAGVNVTVTDNTKITVEGANKQEVGQVAADIYNYYPVEPYKGKGVRIEGKYVIRKEGKKSA